MLTEIQNESNEDLDLVGPDQVKLFIDTMTKNASYNDDFTSSQPGSEARTPIERWLLQLEFFAKQSRADLVKNDIHGVVDEMQELAANLNIPVRRGSQSEKLIGRAMLRAEADYFDGLARRERKERGLPDDNELASLSLDELKARVGKAWDRELGRSVRSADNGRASTHSDAPSNRGNTDFHLSKIENQTALSRTLDRDTPASQVWLLFVHDRQKIEKKKERAGKLTSSLNLWETMHGDKPVKDWTGKMASALRRTFLQLPHDYAQGKKWRSAGNLEEIAEAFEKEIATAPANERVAIMEGRAKRTTWNRHHSTLSSFWGWAQRQGLTTIEKNPFADLWAALHSDIEVSDGGSETRINWDEDHIRELFASPLYTGFKSLYRRHVSGALLVRDALYWVPLIIAYTGMRREEICQLRVEHFCHQDENSIWYFDLKARGLRLKKTKRGDTASKRWVPIPEALIQLGITEALHKGREPTEQLFPDLYRSAADDVFGDNLGKKFTVYRKNHDKYWCKEPTEGKTHLALYARWMDLHSFRHSVCTSLIDLGVPQAHAEEITGHKSQARKTAFANYDKGRTLQILKEAIEKRSLPIDIPRLVAAATRSSTD